MGVIIEKNLTECFKEVRAIVKKVSKKTHSFFLSREDLLNAGFVGILEAERKYDATKGVLFKTFATIRIRGNILNEIRDINPMPKTTYEVKKNIDDAKKKLEVRLGRLPSEKEVASEVGMSLENYRSKVNYIYNYIRFNYKNYESMFEKDSFQRRLEKRELTRIMSEGLSKISAESKLVLTTRFYEDKTIKELQEILGCDKDRALYLQKKAVLELKCYLKKRGILSDLGTH